MYEQGNTDLAALRARKGGFGCVCVDACARFIMGDGLDPLLTCRFPFPLGKLEAKGHDAKSMVPLLRRFIFTVALFVYIFNG